MLLETCRYKVVNGKVTTKMFGMKGKDWDVEPGWYHDKKAAKAAAENPKIKSISAESSVEDNRPAKKIDGRSKAARKLRLARNDNSSGLDR